MKVTVLGCGPAGLMAAHGVAMACSVAQAEVDLQIISRKVKSSLYGCQYLHRPLSFAPAMPVTTVQYKLLGSSDDYRQKVYGPEFYGTVSPEDLLGEHSAWDIRATYDWLWGQYEHLIVDGEVTPRTVWSLTGQDLILSSIPRDALCHQGHEFGYTTIIAAGDAPELGIDIGEQFKCDDNTVICNGLEAPSWYRTSRVFGHTTVEWPSSLGRVPVSSAATVRKPTYTDCTCHPAVSKVGRYGKWQKGVLSHTAYTEGFRAIMLGIRHATA